jgi:hypothetical protein
MHNEACDNYTVTRETGNLLLYTANAIPNSSYIYYMNGTNAHPLDLYKNAFKRIFKWQYSVLSNNADRTAASKKAKIMQERA